MIQAPSSYNNLPTVPLRSNVDPYKKIIQWIGDGEVTELPTAGSNPKSPIQINMNRWLRILTSSR